MTTSRSVLLISAIALILLALVPAVSADEILIDEEKEWVQATAGANWSVRHDHASVVYNGKMWVMGGYATGFRKNDVWWSTDGITWTEATPKAGWSARHQHTSVVYDGKMWLMGGVDVDTRYKDVWWSTDGITWTRATANAGWSGRHDHTSVVYDDKMWVIGGLDGSYKNDVWSSTDGITWTRATANAGWSGRNKHTSLVYDGKMWVIGGYDGSSYKNDVWWSTDGITWTRATAAAAWSERASHTSVVYDGKMWVIGGYDGSSYKNDVWWSTDGITWTQATAAAAWSERDSHTSVVYADKMWVMGGYDDGPTSYNDVWSFTVGKPLRTVTVTMTHVDGTPISGFEVKAVNAYTGEEYTVSTDSDVAYITLPMDRTATVPDPETGKYEETPVGYYNFYGYKPGYKMYPDYAIRVNVLPEKYMPDVFCDIIVITSSEDLRTVTVTMTDIDGNKISGFEVRAVNAVTGESYTVSTDSDVAYITLPMDQIAAVPNPETGEYEEAPVGYYYFYGSKPGYEMFPDYAIRVDVLPEKYMPDVFCDILVVPVGSVPDDPNNSPVIVSVRNSQTGALLGDARVIIKDTTTDPWTEVVNQTLPSGQGTFYLPNDPGFNRDQYYITALLPGYSDIYNGRFFRVAGLIYITVYMEPIEGGPADENNTILEFYVRDLYGNPVSDAMVSVADQARWTNAQGWIRFEVPKNAAYSYTVRKTGYVTLEGTVTVGDGPRHTVNVVLTPEIPTQPPGPGVPTQPTPPGGIPGDDGSEGFLSEAIRGISRIFGVGFATAKTILGMLLALAIGFTTAKKLRGGAAEFGFGLLGGTMLGVLIGLLPVWTVVVLLLIVGMYIGYRYVGGGSNG